MAAYIGLIVILLALSLWEMNSKSKTSIPVALAAFLLVLFVGFRFETGSDWLEYETLINLTPPIFGKHIIYEDPNLIVEPGFHYLLVLLSTLGLGIQTLLFVCAFASIVPLSIVAKKYCSSPLLVIIWYCGFCLLIGQMAAIRQVSAYGFLFLYFIASQKGWKFSGLYIIISASIHVFSLVVAPILLIRRQPPNSIIIISVCILGLILSLLGVNLFTLVAKPISTLAGGMIEFKLGLYNSIGSYALSPVALLLILLHIVVLLLLNRADSPRWRDPLVRSAIYAAIWSLVAHTFFAGLPAIWNRTMLFSMPLEIVGIVRAFAYHFERVHVRVLAPVGVATISMASIYYSLSQDNALPYLPYRSALQVWITGETGDGRLRYEIEQSRLNMRVREQSGQY